MKETEPYIKVHDFLFTDLNLSEMMARIFSFILTKWIGGIPVYRQRYVAEKCRMSDRECKQIFKCLHGIGLIRKLPHEPNGTSCYEPSIDKCRDTTQVKFALVHAIHRCTAFTGARGAPPRCTRCTFGGAYCAPQINIDNTIIKTDNYGYVKREEHRIPDSTGTVEFDGHDTL